MAKKEQRTVSQAETNAALMNKVERGFGRIEPPYWDDKPVAIVGGGLSLKDFDFERLRGAHVLAVKGTIFDIPWADAGFGLDWPRYAEWKDRIAALQMRVYWAVPWDQLEAMREGSGDNVTFLNRLEETGVSNDGTHAIYGGGTSGYGALQVAIHKRARHMVLFGFDYEAEGQYGTRETVGTFRHNEQHYGRKRAQNEVNWANWAQNFQSYVPYFEEHGIKVVNACPQSQIAAFQKVTIDDGVEMALNGWGGK